MSILFVLLFLVQEPIYEAKKIEIKKVETGIKIIVITDAFKYKDTIFHNPERICIDFPNTASYLPRELTSQYYPLIRVSSGQYTSDSGPITRVVLDLEKETPYSISLTKIGFEINLPETGGEVESEIEEAESKVEEVSETDIVPLKEGSIFIQKEPLISVGDRILISAPGIEEIGEKEVFVGSSGKVVLPLLGEIQANSLTPSQLKASIVRALSPYVIEPQIFVNITQSSTNKVCISGEVGKPGVYRFIDGYTIGEAINLAGGATGNADLDHIYVKRADVFESIMDMKKAQEIFVAPLDMIYVPKLEDILVVGEVVYPGVFTPTGSRIRLSDVLAQHSWRFTGNANPKKMKILSGKENKDVEIKRASDTELKPGDVVVILRRSNYFMEVLNFTNRYIPVVTFALMTYWHYY